MIEAPLPRGEHRPQRTCLGCGDKDDQKNLIRIIIGADGKLIIDPRGYGRGGYLHQRHDCWQAFLRRKNTHRAFRVNISKDAKQKLIQVLSEGYRE
jgi:predicted RNA-binding protein YlxR (DUF448 family)